jgi:actin-like ATPase involved in cell morphogenesis
MGEEKFQIYSDDLSAFKGLTNIDEVMRSSNATALPKQLKLDQENVKNGLGQLVLTLIKLLHELLEKQAIRRIEAGNLNDEQIDRLGVTLMKQAEEIERLRKEFGLSEEDLNVDLGPLGKLL